MKGEYQSELLGAIHETAVGLHKIGVIDDKEMKEYDDDCLAQKPKAINKTDSPAKTEQMSRVTV